MKQFQIIEKFDASMFSWFFSNPLSSTRYPYMVESIADSQVFQQTGASVREARQGSCGCCYERETLVEPDRREPLPLLRNKEDWFVKQVIFACSFLPPNLDRLIQTAAGKGLTIRTEGHTGNGACMFGVGEPFLASFHVPRLNRLITAATG
jgi:hypothetical protein